MDLTRSLLLWSKSNLGKPASIVRLIDWLILYWLVDWFSIDWLIDSWLIDSWLIGWLIDSWLIGWSIDWLIGWCINRDGLALFYWLFYWMILPCFLFDLFIVFLYIFFVESLVCLWRVWCWKKWEKSHARRHDGCALSAACCSSRNLRKCSVDSMAICGTSSGEKWRADGVKTALHAFQGHFAG